MAESNFRERAEDWLESRTTAFQRHAFRFVSYRTRRARRIFLRKLDSIGLGASKPFLFLLAAIIGGSIGGASSRWLYPDYYGLALHALGAALVLMSSAPLFLMITIEQKMRRDLDARRILFCQESTNKNITLLLRRHFSDTGILIKKPLISELPSFFTRLLSARGFGDQVDDILFRALRNNSVVLKLSGADLDKSSGPGPKGYGFSRRRTEDLGAGQIFLRSLEDKHGNEEVSEPPWLKVVVQLMMNARQLVIVPLTDSQAALLTELKKVKELDLIGRVVMIMPPSDALHGKYFTSTGSGPNSVSAMWNTGAELIERELAFKLPVYESKGGLVLMSDGQFALFRSVDGLPWTSTYAIRRLLKGGIARSQKLVQSLIFSLGAVCFPLTVAFFLLFGYTIFINAAPDFSSLSGFVLFLLVYGMVSARFAYDWFRKFSDHQSGKVVAVVSGFALPITTLAAEFGFPAHITPIDAEISPDVTQTVGLAASVVIPAVMLTWTFSYFFMKGKQTFQPNG